MLRNLTDFLAFRGPDAREIWCQDSVGFGHALLQATEAAAPDKQPAQLDGRLWIVGDIRIDGRAELLGKLRGKNEAARTLSLASSDAELVLYAFDIWGDGCLEHLIGDFAFAIWEPGRKRLFCARDQFGVKPFYYAHLGSILVFSNTLNCIRKHPAVSNRLNDLAIADFLLFDMNQESSTTSFADVQRLPPAHFLICEKGAVVKRRYWELAVTSAVKFSRKEEYVERFRELLDLAVTDRMRTDQVGVMMSGGLDSTTVAASAQRVQARGGKPSGLRAYTEVFESLIPHEERHYAALSAEALGIPVEFLISDHLNLRTR